jgi:guanylate kinase
MNTNEKGIIIVIEGPSGVGKDTLVKSLMENYPNMFEKVPSMTTREMRENESQGNPYFFVSEERFKQLIADGTLFEYTTRHNTYRGMNKDLFDEVLNRGKFPVKDCDKIGLDALRKIYGNKVFGVFITCPKKEIEARLIGRGESGESLATRLNNYDEYVKNEVYFDTTIENIDLEVATKQLYDKIMSFYNQV